MCKWKNNFIFRKPKLKFCSYLFDNTKATGVQVPFSINLPNLNEALVKENGQLKGQVIVEEDETLAETVNKRTIFCLKFKNLKYRFTMCRL